MIWANAFFEAAYGTAEQLPESDIPEICFSGRSNVGKSSLINKLLGRKALARVSATPGKTVTVNLYRIPSGEGDIRLADLPGYGYAKVPFEEKSRWSELMESYFGSGRRIALCLQLIDMRRPPTDFDISMLKFLRHYAIPTAVVMTKSDKLNKTELSVQTELIKKEVEKICPNAPVLSFSALKGTGAQEIRETVLAAVGAK